MSGGWETLPPGAPAILRVDFPRSTGSALGMPRATWIFAAGLSALVVLFLGVFQLKEFQRQAGEAQAETAKLTASEAALTATNAVLAAQLTAARDLAAELQQAVEQAAQRKSSMEAEFRSALDSKDVTISELQGRLTVDILDRVLFDSGEAVLKPDGETVLSKVAQLLAQYPKRQLQIIGHTDNVPVRVRTAGGFTDNWSLSVGRALAAVRFLETRAGVDPHRLAAVGCGEYRPLADNATAEGRARNRRIAVVVLPEEISDLTKPSGKPSVPSPAVPAPVEPAPVKAE